MSRTCSRRTFLKGSATAVGGVLASVSSGPFVLAERSAGDKLRVAVIGAAGMGGYAVGCALSENLVALVDVDEKNIAQVMKESVKNAAKPKIFYDYRKMLDECHNDLDVVLISTPDHHHAPAAMRAINYGKHVFCQKPLAHNIAECYALAKAAREKKVLTQMGNQGYCGEPIRRVAEYVAAGAIGQVTETHTILDRNFGGTGGRPPSKPIPAGLHWDEWIGPRRIATTTTACIPSRGATGRLSARAPSATWPAIAWPSPSWRYGYGRSRSSPSSASIRRTAATRSIPRTTSSATICRRTAVSRPASATSTITRDCAPR